MTVTKDTQDDSNLQAQITITLTVLYTGCHYCRRDPHRHVQLRYVPPTISHHGLADLCNGLAVSRPLLAGFLLFASRLLSHILTTLLSLFTYWRVGDNDVASVVSRPIRRVGDRWYISKPPLA